MDRTYNLVELFSGIGSQAKALTNIGFKINTVGTCEWDVHAFSAYDAIHNSPYLPDEVSKLTKEEILDQLKKYTLSNNGKEPMAFKTLTSYTTESLKKIYGALLRSNNFVDVSSLTGDSMPENIDIMTYSFPCQDLSNVGAFHGYNKGIDKGSGSRSSLLWQVGRILKEMKDDGKNMPRYLLMENVPALLANRHFTNFRTWISDLNKLGYVSRYFQLNARSFGLPQNRPRLLMISVYVGDNKDKKNKMSTYLNGIFEDTVVSDYEKSPYYRKYEMAELFRTDYTNQKLFIEACECTPNATPSRQTIWENNPQLVTKGGTVNPEFDHIRTITCKQDRNPNSGNLWIDTGIKGRSEWRYLTPRECFLFMGFTDEDYDRIIMQNPEFHANKVLFPRDKLIRMAGNSIPVKLLEGVFWQIKLLEDHTKAI